MRTVTRGVARRVPPVLTGFLLVMWLLLNETLSIGHIALGSILAVGLAWAASVLRPLRPEMGRPLLVVKLIGLVLFDIVRSNIGVARIVLRLVRDRKVRSGFVKIPLDLTDPHGLAVLAGIVTATPGTVWVDHDLATSTLTLHVLDLKSEQDWIDWIKQRYERLLEGIFE
jgi:multicomponent K+:H+ antiporter subunit E